MFAARAVLAIAVSVIALLLSLVLDRILAPLSLIPQFLIQIPVLVLAIDTIRQMTVSYLTHNFDLTDEDINGTFFFAAPLAAVASTDLMAEIRRKIAAA